MSRTTGRHLHPDTTHWSLVMSPDAHDPVLAQSSLLALCHRYWYPVYAFVRRSGHEPGRAHELTRMFFQRLVAGEAPRD